jgi:phytoene dehydrogenase-like protein
MSKSVIIIGAGIAGLCAGCYAQMNGYHSTIFEAHNVPGGLCTSWKRKGYTFDGCIQMLMGTGPGTIFHRVWQELGVLDGQRVVDHDEFMRVEGPDGRTFIAYTDVDRLEQHMKALSPIDAHVIEEFTAAVRLFSRFDPPLGRAFEQYGPLQLMQVGLRMLPFMGALARYGRMSIQTFAARFQDPFLREALPLLFFLPDLPDFPMVMVLMVLGLLHRRSAGYPIGGSLKFARMLERRYRGLGGEVCYRAPVQQILVEQGRAVGVRLADGTERRADIVISAADAHKTIFEMFDGRYVDDAIRNDFKQLPLWKPVIQVSLGINRDMIREPHTLTVTLDKPVMIARQPRTRLCFHHYAFDPSMAPSGKTTMICLIESDYQWWKQLSADRAQYEAEKQRIAAVVIEQLNRRFPGIVARVEVVDVASPLTTVRYTGNWRGSVMGWGFTTRSLFGLIRKAMRKPHLLPGLRNFYMAGQWTEPVGGVPTVAVSGRNVVALLCSHEHKPFVTTCTEPSQGSTQLIAPQV